MTASVNVKITILWDHELRAAAKALHKCLRPENLNDEDFQPNIDDYNDAIKACAVALHCPDLVEDDTHLTILSKKSYESNIRDNND